MAPITPAQTSVDDPSNRSGRLTLEELRGRADTRTIGRREATSEKLDRLRDDLKREFRRVPTEEINDPVDALAVRLLTTARFDDFVPLLVQRYSREHLSEKSHAIGLWPSASISAISADAMQEPPLPRWNSSYN
jgi:hypothetical protein